MVIYILNIIHIMNIINPKTVEHRVFFAPCLYLRPQFRPRENQRGKGEGPLEGERGRVPGRTCRRSGCCGFPEVLGLFRADFLGV